MKPLFKKVISFLAVLAIMVVAINYVIWDVYKPGKEAEFFYKHEDGHLIHKFDRYVKSGVLKEGDNIFIGSSTTFRQFNPVWFDSVLNTGAVTYNLSIGGFFPFRSLDLLQFAEKTKKVHKLNYFIELRGLHSVNDNYDSDPIINSLSWDKYMITFDFAKRERAMNLLQKAAYSTTYTVAVLNRYLNLGFFNKTEKDESAPDVSDTSRGFYPFDYENGKDYQERKRKFVQSNYKLGTDLKTDPKVYQAIWKELGEDKYLSYLLEVVKKVKSDGNNVMFFIPPRTSRDRIQCYKEKLIEEGIPVLDLANPQIYPELYSVTYSFDAWHLNRQGALLFTSSLAKQYQQISSSQTQANITAN